MFVLLLVAGFELIFGMSAARASALSLLPVVAMGVGLLNCAGTIMYYASLSKLLPTRLSLRSEDTGSPYVSLGTAAFLGFCVCLLVHFTDRWHSRAVLFNFTMLCSFVVHIISSIGYVYLQLKFQDFPREYRSPVGIAGAGVSISIWVLCVLSVAAFQRDYCAALVVFLVYCATVSALYVTLVARQQRVSEVETILFFKAHVINCKFLRSAPICYVC